MTLQHRVYSVASRQFLISFSNTGNTGSLEKWSTSGLGREHQDEPEHLVGQGGRKPSLEDKDMKEEHGAKQEGEGAPYDQSKDHSGSMINSDCADYNLQIK